jgi:hypothetical protein
LRALSEDHIFYPGSTTIGELSYAADGIDAGGAEPYTGWLLGTSARQVDVLEYYDQQLLKRGWSRNDLIVIQTDAETTVAGWQKDGYVFRLGFMIPGDPRTPGNGKYPTVYRFQISAKSNA